jgi:hypothetical protein
MTDQDLLEIEQRANGATAGPWHVHRCDSAGDGEACAVRTDGDRDSSYSYTGIFYCTNYDECSHMVRCSDAAFIAHARTDVPALVAEVRRLRGLLEGGPPCPFPAGGVWTGQAWVPGDHPLADPANREPVECGAAWPGPPLPWDCACNRPMGHSGNHTHTSPNGVVGSHWK